jgi:hypothetical protein
MADVGPYAEQLFFLALESNPMDWRRTIQGILSLHNFKKIRERISDLNNQ